MDITQDSGGMGSTQYGAPGFIRSEDGRCCSNQGRGGGVTTGCGSFGLAHVGCSPLRPVPYTTEHVEVHQRCLAFGWIGSGEANKASHVQSAGFVITPPRSVRNAASISSRSSPMSWVENVWSGSTSGRFSTPAPRE